MILNIKSYLPVFPGFYNTLFECDCEEQELDNLEETTGKEYSYDDINWDYSEYGQRVSEACVGAIEHELKSSGFDIIVNFEELRSPKEYNFYNDSVNVEYSLSEETYNKLIAYLKDNEEAFVKYLERYNSRSGFMSFYSSNLETWYEEYLQPGSDKLHHCFGSILEFYFENEGYSDNDLYDAVAEQCYYIDYTIPGED